MRHLLSGRFPQIILRDNIKSVKPRSRFVTGNPHRYYLGDTCSRHVPDRSPSEVVEEHSG